MNLGIAGQSVEKVTFGYAVTLVTDKGVELRIETGFSIHVDGRSVVVDPEKVGVQAPLVLSRLHRMITAGTADDESGRLELSFVEGHRIEVHSTKFYEAWTCAAPDGTKVVAQPGGGLITWRGAE